MTAVFISGSRQIPNPPEDVRERIDSIVSKELDILLGDSEKGIDNSIASYLKKSDYRNVTIFSIHSSSRIKNLPTQWVFKIVTPSVLEKRDKNGKIINGRDLEVAKDRVMGNLCSYGLVIWQDTYTNSRFGQKSVSSGSLRNMVQLLLNHKPVVLYHRRENGVFDDFCFTQHDLRTVEQLRNIVQQLDSIVIERFQKILKEETAHLEVQKNKEQLQLAL
jgi:hypothetical protein